VPWSWLRRDRDRRLGCVTSVFLVGLGGEKRRGVRRAGLWTLPCLA
jgi:hypothetical protein